MFFSIDNNLFTCLVLGCSLLLNCVLLQHFIVVCYGSVAAFTVQVTLRLGVVDNNRHLSFAGANDENRETL